MKPLRRTWRLLLPALMALLLVPGVVWAHAELVESNPPEGGTIATPGTLTATFSEPLGGNSRIVVRDGSGAEVARGGISPDDPQVLVVELPELPTGAYSARWTAVGTDGHVERGDVNFSVTPAATPSPSPTPAPTVAPTATSAPTPTGQPVITPTPVPPPPTAIPTATPTVTPGEGEPTVGAADMLVSLGLAALLIGAMFVVLWRRRAA